MLMRAFALIVVYCAVLAAIAGAQSVVSTPGCYNIVTTTVTVTSTSCTAPTPTPTVAPTPTPTPNPGSLGGYINGQPFPAGWRPFPTSAWLSSPLPAISPGYYTTNSAAIVAAQWAQSATSMGQALHNSEPGIFDTSVPIYAASTSSPVVNLVNPTYGNNLNVQGGIPATLQLPLQARPTQSVGLVSNLSTFDLAGNEIDLMTQAGVTLMNPNGIGWKTGVTMPAASYGQSCSNFYTGNGMNTGSVSTTTMGQCGVAGLVGVNDLQRGEIDHTLLIYPNCVAAGYVAPSVGATPAIPASICTSGPAPQIGATVWYDVSCATTKAAGLQPWQTGILCALNTYGGVVAGTLTGGTIGVGAGSSSGQFGFTIGLESSETFYAYANGDSWAIMFNQAWTGETIPGFGSGYQRWTARPQDASGNTLLGVNLASHIHYLVPCVKAQGC